MSFIHLQVKSSYSLLSSTLTLEKIVELAKKNNASHVALTDVNAMYGAMEFYDICKKHDVTPIFGLEFTHQYQGKDYQLIALAKNKRGYQNLMKISSFNQLNDQFIDFNELHKFRDGLVLITPQKNSYITTCILNHHPELIKDYMTQLNILSEHVFVGISNHHTTMENMLNKELIQRFDETKLVLLNDVLYEARDDKEYYEVLVNLRDGKKLNESDAFIAAHDENYFKSNTEMFSLFKNDRFALNSVHIAHMCHVEFNFGGNLIPKYEETQGLSENEYLTQLCLQGLNKRLKGEDKPEYKRRLKFELDIINSMGFSNYFLIVWDFIKYAKNHHILVGPGRGSAAGSLVSYCLGITNVDPIEYDLLFERFLNPERISMPDIDIDFPDNKRDQVIEYVSNKYGKNHVAHIITFGTLGAKAAIRDVGRVLDVPLKMIDKLSKLVPRTLNITLNEAYEESYPFRRYVDSEPVLQRVLKIALKLEGLHRHTSTHAAGIVLSDIPLDDVIPMQKGNESLNISQYSMNYLERLGLIKMDFLGLRNLTILNYIQAIIKSQLKVDININEIPMDDEKTFEMLAKGHTTGVFQLESSGMRQVLRRLRPSEFEDIVACNALFRPGPMDNIPLYIERKHLKESFNYIHQDLEPILKPTYGVIVYQEQIMQIVQKMANYRLGEADILRRAVSKKKEQVLKDEREKFVVRSMRNGYDRAVANDVYDLIVRFANYGFNRSHSVAYSIIGYQLAYLKANYPLYFISALLTSVIGSSVKTKDYLAEAKKYQIEVLSPSINLSHHIYTVENGKIRYALSAITNVGQAVYQSILKERENGPFTDFFDFVKRTIHLKVNRNVIEALIDSGAFDEFNQSRRACHENLEVIMDYLKLFKDNNQLSFTDSIIDPPKFKSMSEYGDMELLTREFNSLGVYLRSHPVDPFKVREENHFPIASLNGKIDKYVSIIGYVDKTKEIKTKKGDRMAFVTLSDESASIEGVIFPNVYRTLRDSINGKVIRGEGKITEKESNLQIVLDKIQLL